MYNWFALENVKSFIFNIFSFLFQGFNKFNFNVSLVSYTFSFFDPFLNLINYNIYQNNICSFDYFKKLYFLKEKNYFTNNKYNSFFTNKRFLTNFVLNFNEKFIRKDMFNI